MIPLSPTALEALAKLGIDPADPIVAQAALIAQEIACAMILRDQLPPTVAPVQQAPQPGFRDEERRVAASKGFTGDFCLSCGSLEMVRTGTCTTCQACGNTSGGCS